jgi:hypothetical protein
LIQPTKVHISRYPAHESPVKSFPHLIVILSGSFLAETKAREEKRLRGRTMARKRKELLSSAPWRTGEAEEDDEAARMSREGKVSVTSNPGETATMNVPRSKRPDLDLAVDDFEEDDIDPELRYSFQRNSRVRQPRTNLFLITPLPSPPCDARTPWCWAMRSRCSENCELGVICNRNGVNFRRISFQD